MFTPNLDARIRDRGMTWLKPMRVRVYTHPSSLLHDPGRGHPESPQRLSAILEELHSPDMDARVDWCEAQPAGWSDLELVHPRSHLKEIESLALSGGGMFDYDTFVSPASFDAARHAAGAAIGVVQAALERVPAFAAIRPPGHHANADTAMGFCLINNVVVAAHHAIERCGAERVLIIDWDVHHGNGTQDLVVLDSRIRYVSLHQWPLYPGTGHAEETGVGNIFNVPRKPGLPREVYIEDLNEAVDAATRDWIPDVILVSAGFDAMKGDPLAGFTLEPLDYGTWIRHWRSMGVPIGAVLEGGYAPQRIRLAAAEMIRALSEDLESSYSGG